MQQRNTGSPARLSLVAVSCIHASACAFAFSICPHRAYLFLTISSINTGTNSGFQALHCNPQVSLTQPGRNADQGRGVPTYPLSSARAQSCCSAIAILGGTGITTSPLIIYFSGHCIVILQSCWRIPGSGTCEAPVLHRRSLSGRAW